MNDQEMLRQAIEVSRTMNRRRFLRRSGLTLGALGMGPALLAACGDDSTETGSGGGADNGTETGELYFANWTAYIDEESVKDFEAKSGKKMKYTEEYNDNNEFFAKIRPELAQGKQIAQDLIAPSFWMASRLIGLGWADKIDFDKIPNSKNLRDDLVNPVWDPTGEYTLPWQSGFAGIAYNSDVTGRELKSVDDLWDPAFKGKIGLLTEMRDTLGLVAMSKGVDIANPTADAFGPALEEVRKQVDSGQVRQFTGNDYMDDLSQGSFAACIGWSGDIAQLQKDNPALQFVIPETGGTLWSDTMLRPKGANNGELAAEWMDFVYDPVNAARITAFVQYVSPVKGVQEELRKMGGEAADIAESPLLFPDENDTRNLQSFGQLSDADEETLDSEFSKIQGN